MGPLQQEGVEGAGEIAPRAPTKTTSRSNSKVLSHGQESAIISVYEGLMDAGSDKGFRSCCRGGRQPFIVNPLDC